MKGLLLLALVRLFLLGAAVRANLSLVVGFVDVRTERRLQAKSETSDANILCDFYNTIPASANKAKLTNWCGAKSGSSYVDGPCTGTARKWLGVSCAVVGGVRRVTSLSTCLWSGSACLGVTGIGGSLPNSIGGLGALTKLDLGAARILGSIPSSVGVLTSLTYLSFGSNSLSGSIPPSLGALTELTMFFLQGNLLSGTIPSSLGALTRLNAINLSANSLSGTIPPSLGALTKATLLSLTSNALAGSVPTSFCNIYSLEVRGNPGLTCYPSCMSTNSYFMANKGSLSAVCAGIPNAYLPCALPLSNANFEQVTPAQAAADHKAGAPIGWIGVKGVNTVSGGMEVIKYGPNRAWMCGSTDLPCTTGQLPGAGSFFLGLQVVGSSITQTVAIPDRTSRLVISLAASYRSLCIRCALKGEYVIEILIGRAIAGRVTVSTAPGVTWATYTTSFDVAPAWAGTRQDFTLRFASGCTGDCTVYVDLVTVSALARIFGGELVCAIGSETSDADVLCEFYNTMPAASKAKLTKWCGPKSGINYVNGPCTGTDGRWLGVACAVVGGVNRVISLDTCLYRGTTCAGATGLGGNLPNSIGGLDALTWLDLGQGRVSGTIPPSLGGLIGLVKLSFNSNSFSGTIPSSLGALTKLASLYLNPNSLAGPVPASFCSLKASVDVDVRGNPGLTCYPSCLSSYSTFMRNRGSLSAVCVVTAETSDANILCEFYNTMPASANKAKLTNWCGAGDASSVCGAAGTSSWGGVTCAVVGGVNRVTRIDTYGVTSLGGTLPMSIGGLGALTEINLSLSGISGSIPSSLGALTGLTAVYFSTNALSGSIPSSLGALTGLNALHLGSNRLSGTIPLSLGGLTRLINIYFYHNSLSGSIPSSLGGLIGLIRLHLDTNRLSGTIPTILGGLTKLTTLLFNNNRLTGTIPSSLGSLTALRELYFFSNSLSGSIPSSFCDIYSLQVSGNPGLTCYPFCLSSEPAFMAHRGSLNQVCVCTGAATDPFSCIRPASEAQLNPQIVPVAVTRTTTTASTGTTSGKIAAFTDGSFKNAEAVKADITVPLAPTLANLSLVPATTSSYGQGGRIVSKEQVKSPEMEAESSVQSAGSRRVIESTSRAMAAFNSKDDGDQILNTLAAASVVVPVRLVLQSSCLSSVNFNAPAELEAVAAALFKAWDVLVTDALCAAISYDAVKRKQTERGAVAVKAIRQAQAKRKPQELAAAAKRLRVKATRLYAPRRAVTSRSIRNATAAPRLPTRAPQRSPIRPRPSTPQPVGPVVGVQLEFSVTLSVNLLVIASHGGLQFFNTSGLPATADDDDGTSAAPTAAPSAVAPGATPTRFARALKAPATKKKPAKTKPAPRPGGKKSSVPPPSLSPTASHSPITKDAANVVAGASNKPEGIKSSLTAKQKKKNQENCEGRTVCRRLSSKAAVVSGPRFPSCLEASDLAVLGTGAAKSQYYLLTQRPPRSRAPPRAPQVFAVTEVIDGVTKQEWDANNGRFATIFVNQASKALHLNRRTDSLRITSVKAAGGGGSGGGGQPRLEVACSISLANPRKQLSLRARQSAAAVIRSRLAKLGPALRKQGLPITDAKVLAASTPSKPPNSAPKDGKQLVPTPARPATKPATNKPSINKPTVKKPTTNKNNTNKPTTRKPVAAASKATQPVTIKEAVVLGGVTLAAYNRNKAANQKELIAKEAKLLGVPPRAVAITGVKPGPQKNQIEVAFKITSTPQALNASTPAAAAARVRRVIAASPQVLQSSRSPALRRATVVSVRTTSVSSPAPAVGTPFPSPSPSPGPSAPTFVPCSINCPALPEPCGFYQTCGNGCYCGTLQTGPTQFPTQMPTTNSFFFSQPQRRRRVPSPPPTRARVRRPATGATRGQRGQGAAAPSVPSAATATTASSVAPTPVSSRPSAPTAGALSQPQVSPPLSSAPSMAPSSVASTTRPSITFSDPTAAPVPVQASSQTDGSAQGSRGLGSGATGGVVAGCVVVAVLVTVAAFLSSKKKQAAAGPAHLHELYPGGGFTPYVGTRTSRGSRSSMRQSFDHASPMHHQQHHQLQQQHQQEQEHDQPRRDSRRLSITAPSSSSASSRGSLSHASPPSHPHRTSLSLPPGVAAAVGHQSFRAGASLALQSKQLAESGRRRQSHRPSFVAGDAL